MSEIVFHVWSSLEDLTSTQWIIVATLSIIIGVAIFKVLNWLYRTRHETQRDLLQLKDEQIQYYASIVKDRYGASDTTSADAIIPAGWHPFIEQAYAYLEGELSDAMSQQEMNRLSADLAFIADAELFITYTQLQDALATPERKGLRKEQARWLESRQRKAEFAVESHGGSLAPLEFNMTFLDITKQRREALVDRLQLLKPDTAA